MERAFQISILILLCAVLLISAGCYTDFDCDIKDYGEVYFTNNSSTSRNYTVYIDNEPVGVITPGQTTNNDKIKLGKGDHEIIFRFSTGEIACGWIATINQCGDYELTCSI